MPEITVDLNVLCECGNELSVEQKCGGEITVTPCQNCLDQKYDEGQTDLQKEFDRG